MLGNHGRTLTARLLGPLARWLLRRGAKPNTVTLAGTAFVILAALSLLGTGRLVIGPIVLGALLLLDSVDGLMAREGGGPTRFGSFLDSTLDRLADAAVFSGLVLYFLRFTESPILTAGVLAATAALALGAVVPYVRAKAEALGRTAKVGIAERADRLLIALAATFAVGLGLSAWVLVVALAVLSCASAITVAQRIALVARQESQA